MKTRKMKIASLVLCLLMYSILSIAQNPGTGVVTVTANGGSCVGFTVAQGSGPDNWEVAEGGSYTMTITGVTECVGSEITVFVQSSSVGNFCFNASGGNGTYSGTFTMPAVSCYTMPISYKCGADQTCDNSNTYDADGPSNNNKVHLRSSNFDGSCNKTSTDEDCGSCVAEIEISADGNTTLCPGSCVTLTATGGVSYLWSTGESGESIEVCEEGEYSVVGVDGNNCSDGSNVISVSFYTSPEVTVSALGNTSICPGSCVTLSASGATDYVWSPNGETTETIEACGAGAYSVVGTDANGCTDASDPVDIIVFTPPTVEVTVDGETTACSPNCVTLTASGADNYVWSPNGETTTSIQACATGAYTVVGTDANGCTDASASVDVTIFTPPTVEVSADGPTSVCSPNCVTLTASGADNYVWSPNGETTTSIQACATGSYSVVGTDANGCTDASSSVDITIFTPPTVGISANGPTTVCSPNCVTLTASGADDYVWSPNGETTTSIQACATGSYSVVGTDANGCTDASSSISVTITPTPSCTLSVPTTLPICGLGGNTLTATVNGPTTSKVWTVSSSNNSWQITAGQGTNSITYKAGTSGTTGTFTLTVSNGSCSSTCTVTFGSSCVEYCGYTQGFYGGSGKTCDGTQTALQAINAALTSGGNLVAGFGTRTVTILTTEGSCLKSKMPAGTGPDTIPTGSVTCATATGTKYLNSGKFKPVLLGQVIALTLNIRLQPSLGSLPLTSTYFTTYGATSCTNGTAVPGTKQVYPIHQNVLNCLGANNTVSDLLALANKALGYSIPAGCSATASQINDAVDAINRGFDKCRILAGFTNTSAGIRIMDPSVEPEVSGIRNLKMDVMPNPLTENSVVYFNAPVNSTAVVEMYNMNGAKISTLMNEMVEEGKPYAVEINSEELKPGIYFIKANVGGLSAVSKVIVIND